MADLKPCPFCGGEAEMQYIGTCCPLYFISCKECGCKQATSISKEAVIEAWNTRKPMEAVVAELEAFARENDREPNAGFIDMCIEIVRGKE
jgi:Lar family restriction alleviation protein